MSRDRRHSQLQSEILSACLRRQDYVQTGGDPSNNWLHIESIRDKIPLQRQVVGALGRLAIDHKADMLMAVPKGGDWLAEAVSFESEVPFVLLHLDKTGEVDFLPGVRDKVEGSQAIVVVSDVLNHLRMIEKVLALPGVAERTAAVIGVVDRDPLRQTDLQMPVEAVLSMPIAPMLAADDRLRKYVPSG